jgi:hypothetical protein
LAAREPSRSTHGNHFDIRGGFQYLAQTLPYKHVVLSHNNTSGQASSLGVLNR